jgi:quinol monooxygenase YgiN
VTAIARGRFTAQPDPDEHAGLVLFHIGMRINRLRSPRTWLPVLLAMPRMLRELSAQPELGLLSFEVFRSGRTFLVVQYWRDFAALDAWARSADAPHLPAWRAFNRAARRSDAAGVFHETFVVGVHGSETVYVDMPVMGLARATRHVPIAARGQSAAHRIDPAVPDSPAVTPDEVHA